MGKIHVIDRDGSEHTVEAIEGEHLMTILRDEGFVRGECGGLMICSTCHIKIDANWREKTGEVPDEEVDLIDGTGNFQAGASRLGCQIDYTDALDGLRLTIGEDI
jgi:2Fe-2S ferredoxin